MPSMLPLLFAREKLVISGQSFDAETTIIIGEAFDQACKEMRDEGATVEVSLRLKKQVLHAERSCHYGPLPCCRQIIHWVRGVQS